MQAKDFIKGIDMFNDPVNWASFQVYGRDCLLDVEELRRREAETSFVEAQKLAVERFAIVGQRKGIYIREKVIILKASALKYLQFTPFFSLQKKPYQV